ncbi:hypothetical protein [Candidatus Nitrospira bockiana]
MTEDQARQLRERWRQGQAVRPCRHYQLELLWTEKGEATERYACILCGTEVGPPPPGRDRDNETARTI